ncbi:cation diffusion facilitator CzcD-associated flavoprotein CzcO [Litorivivens lipolytica]|uniref:Cation diffusion facilitator CzcD-associated flavoprotein CzcO n=1 Tax=Litorivivens lipolytica TaxID=1524264 RepID=A0A7W4W706_9GAMM|nr:NAD(P)/FAD-dependent oxidoreductase [Litorivivens lipolytica]MBB3048223.1 cation diffusion facilitator CzcD-associated flavoprotein CzcO [Litorivivens lipolytica]
MGKEQSLRIAIIGAGPAGIAAGKELLDKGFSEFTVFDALDAPGGTWRLHNYPGLACDVWAHSYTFSYAPNPDWSETFVGHAEIQAYLARCAREFGVEPHLQLNTRIVSAHFQEEGVWELTTEKGERHRFDAIINAMGNQHTPLYPNVPGRDLFKGDSWHGTRWNHDVDLTGKHVVVVGSAASAIQIVPNVAKVAGHLTVLQRSANWIMPRNNKPYSAFQRSLFRRFPVLLTLLRKWQGLLMGQVEYAVTNGHARQGQFEEMVKKFIRRSVDDPALQEALIPDTPYGCKRGLVSDDFYPTLNRGNVDLIAEGLKEVTATGIVTSSGKVVDADVIIYCTGYRIQDFDRIDVRGVDGKVMGEVMAADPRSHKGIAVPDFPNYFFAVGPNGVVLNVSYFLSVEKNVETIVRLLGELQRSGRKVAAVKRDVFERYNEWMADRFARFSWGASTCNSYYRDASGHAPFLFPGNYAEYRKIQEQSTLDDYQLS